MLTISLVNADLSWHSLVRRASFDIIIAHVNLCTQVLTSVILCLSVQLHNVY